MAISSPISKNQYTSSGESIFAYTFKIYAQADIKVLVDSVEQTITTDYTVSGVGSGSGGNITFTSPTTSGEIITIQRNEPLTQEIVYVEGDDFPAASHEEGLDRSVLRDQLLQEQVDRSLKLPEGTTSSLAFTDPAGNGGQYLKLNTAASTIEYSALVSTPSEIVISGGDAGKVIVVNATEDDIEVGSALGTLATENAAGVAADVVFDGLVDVTNVNAKTSAGGALRTNGGTSCITWGGGGSANSTLGGNMSGASTHKLVNMVDPTSAQDYATKNYVDSNSGISLQSSVATTSGTSVNLSGVPATANRVTLHINSVSSNGTSAFLLQLNDGSVVTTGYAGITFVAISSAVNTAVITSGFQLSLNQSAATVLRGKVVLERATGNRWNASGDLFTRGDSYSAVSGDVTLSSDLAGLRLTTVGGTDTFDAGSISISWES